MPRLTPVDKEIIRALIEADAARDEDEDEAERFRLIYRVVLNRWGLAHAARLEEIALWVNLRRSLAVAPGSVRETCPESGGAGVTQTPAPSLASVIGG